MRHSNPMIRVERALQILKPQLFRHKNRIEMFCTGLCFGKCLHRKTIVKKDPRYYKTFPNSYLLMFVSETIQVFLVHI